eukprot:g6622.t1
MNFGLTPPKGSGGKKGQLQPYMHQPIPSFMMAPTTMAAAMNQGHQQHLQNPAPYFKNGSYGNAAAASSSSSSFQQSYGGHAHDYGGFTNQKGGKKGKKAAFGMTPLPVVAMNSKNQQQGAQKGTKGKGKKGKRLPFDSIDGSFFAKRSMLEDPWAPLYAERGLSVKQPSLVEDVGDAEDGEALSSEGDEAANGADATSGPSGGAVGSDAAAAAALNGMVLVEDDVDADLYNDVTLAKQGIPIAVPKVPVGLGAATSSKAFSKAAVPAAKKPKLAFLPAVSGGGGEEKDDGHVAGENGAVGKAPSSGAIGARGLSLPAPTNAKKKLLDLPPPGGDGGGGAVSTMINIAPTGGTKKKQTSDFLSVLSSDFGPTMSGEKKNHIVGDNGGGGKCKGGLSFLDNLVAAAGASGDDGDAAPLGMTTSKVAAGVQKKVASVLDSMSDAAAPMDEVPAADARNESLDPFLQPSAGGLFARARAAAQHKAEEPPGPAKVTNAAMEVDEDAAFSEEEEDDYEEGSFDLE